MTLSRAIAPADVESSCTLARFAHDVAFLPHTLRGQVTCRGSRSDFSEGHHLRRSGEHRESGRDPSRAAWLPHRRAFRTIDTPGDAFVSNGPGVYVAQPIGCPGISTCRRGE